MVEFSDMSDEQLAKIAGVKLPTASPAPTAALAPTASVASNAILGQESGNNPNIHNSIDGAVGMAQIMPATFKQYAQPNERIDNPADNLAVHQRMMADYDKRYNGDPARIAVAYFSGPGNVAPAGSSTPWKTDHHDGNGKTVSGYVSDVLKRVGNSMVPQANAAENNFLPKQQSAEDKAPASEPLPYDGLSDEQLAQIAGIQLEKPAERKAVAQAPGLLNQSMKYFGEVADAVKSGVHDLSTVADEGANGPESMKASDELLKGASADLSNGQYLGASRKVMNAFNAAVRDTGPGRAFSGLGKIVTSPAAPIFNDVGKIADAAGVPQDVMEGIGNVGMAYGGMKLAAGKPAITTSVEPARPAIPLQGEDYVAPKFAPNPGEAHPYVAQVKAEAAPASAPLPVTPETISPLAARSMPTQQGQPLSIPPVIALERPANPFFIPAEKPPESLKKTDEGQALMVSPKAFRGGEDIVVQAMKDEGITPALLNEAAAALEKNGKDSPQTAVDILTEKPGEGRNLVQLLSAAINMPGQGAKMAGGLSLRGKASSARIGTLLDSSISSEKYYDTQKAVADTKIASSPIYKQAMAEAAPIDIAPVLSGITDQMTTAKGGIKTALTRAKDLLTDAEGMPETTLQTLHNVKLALDDAIDASGKDSSMGRLSKAKLIEVKNQLLQQMDATNPLYRQARTKYADAAGLQNALEQGRDFMKMDKEEIGQFMKNEDISNPEKTAFATGVRRALADTIERRREGTNPIMALNNEAVKGRISQLFSDPAKVESFYRSIAAEQHMHDINGVLGGSPTAPRLEYAKQIHKSSTKAGTIAKTVIEPQGALANGVGNLIDKQFKSRDLKLSTDQAATIVRMLTTKDPEALRYLAKKLEK